MGNNEELSGNFNEFLEQCVWALARSKIAEMIRSGRANEIVVPSTYMKVIDQAFEKVYGREVGNIFGITFKTSDVVPENRMLLMHGGKVVAIVELDS